MTPEITTAIVAGARVDSSRLSRSRLRGAVELVVNTSDVAWASISLADGSQAYLGVAAGVAAALGDVAGGFAGTVLATNEALLVDDVRNDPRFSALPMVVSGAAVRSYVGAPVRSKDGTAVGVYGLYRTHPMQFGPEDAASIMGLASWASGEFDLAVEEDAAERVQRSLRPRLMPAIAGFDLAGDCVPTLSIGGDFFDWYPVQSGVALTLGDVMGKGVGAGMLASGIRAALRGVMDIDDPAVAVQMIDRALAGDFEAAQSFSTLFHAHLRPADGRLRFADAGHGLTVVTRRSGETQRLESGNFPVGLLAGQDWRWQEISLEPGDTLVSVSDGLLDLYDGTLASIREVEEIAQNSSSAQDVVDDIVARARRQDAPDDVTVIALRRVLL